MALYIGMTRCISSIYSRKLPLEELQSCVPKVLRSQALSEVRGHQGVFSWSSI